MVQTLEVHAEDAQRSDRALVDAHPRQQAQMSPIEHFVSELQRMTPKERISASRYSMTLKERSIYAARYPDEAPTVNGELEWIALNLE